MSPLYFVPRLPATLAIAGEEDTSVSVQNAVMLDSAFRRVAGDGKDRTVVVTELAGHDTDPVIAGRMIRQFLARHLNTPVGTSSAGGDAR